MIFAGIDYSLSSPAVCTYDEAAGDFCFQNCNFFLLSDKKIPKTPKNIYIESHKPWSDPNERYHNIATFFLDNIKTDKILIEDYSMGSKGKVFHIAENTEVLQYNLWLKKIQYKKIPPTSLKKTVTGKGNAPKEVMYQQFLKEEKTDIFKLLGLKMPKTGKIDSPISDIVDSFFLCRYAFINRDV